VYIFDQQGVQRWSINVFKSLNFKSIAGFLEWRRFCVGSDMRIFVGLILWCILLVLCWPIAIIMLVLFPLVWLILLPFRIVGFTLEVVIKFIGAILTLPFRVIGIK
jgi:uncharacterized membrane protein